MFTINSELRFETKKLETRKSWTGITEARTLKSVERF